MANVEPLPAGESRELEEARPSAGARLRSAAVEIITTVALALVIYLVVQTFVVQTYQVHQQSMVPTLLPGQHLLVDKLTPRIDDYSRGDVVVFHPPASEEDDTPFIKRIIGVVGDRVEIRSGGVFINGTRLDEPYLEPEETTRADCGDATWQIEQGELFLMGDHRTQSQDSRCFGPVEVSQVIGRAWLRFWPLDTFSILPTPTYPSLIATQ